MCQCVDYTKANQYVETKNKFKYLNVFFEKGWKCVNTQRTNTKLMSRNQNQNRNKLIRRLIKECKH